MGSEAIAVDLAQVGVSYSQGAGSVLRGVNLTVRAGEFVVVVGRSGAGKTTLLKVAAGLIEPSSGAVERVGRVRMVFQEPLLLPWLTTRGNLDSGLWGEIRNAPSRRQRVDHVLAQIGIDALAERYPHELSGGERQRVAFGRALAGDPDVICCDEPFAQLDVLTRERMQVWLLDIWEKRRTTVLFCTHDLEEALLLGDRVWVLSNGVLETVYEVPFPRPRSGELRYRREFLDARRHLHSLLGS